MALLKEYWKSGFFSIANNLELDQTQNNVRPILDPDCLTQTADDKMNDNFHENKSDILLS